MKQFLPCKIPALSVILSLVAVTCPAGDSPGSSVIVRNHGYPGANAEEALKRLPDILAERPDHLVIFFGMNDALWPRKMLSVATYRVSLETMVARARETGVKWVALVTIHPINPEYVAKSFPDHPRRQDLQQHLTGYDQAVREAAASTGAILVDWRARFLEKSPGASLDEAVSNREDCLIRCVANSGSADGLHLTRDGYRLLAEAVAGALRERVKTGDTITCFGDSLTYGSQMEGKGTATGDTYPANLAVALNDAAFRTKAAKQNGK